MSTDNGYWRNAQLSSYSNPSALQWAINNNLNKGDIFKSLDGHYYVLYDSNRALEILNEYVSLWTDLYSGKIMAYASGGLANFTGPAWLDGTASAPELVLNATDTANFIALKDILSDIMRGAHERASDKSNPEGNNYYDIEVHVDSVDSDYDVDQAVERMKELIEADAMYRNVNAVQKS